MLLRLPPVVEGLELCTDCCMLECGTGPLLEKIEPTDPLDVLIVEDIRGVLIVYIS